MKKVLIPLVLVLALSICAEAQPSIEWQRSFGGTQYDDAYAIQQTADSGYIIAGASI